MKLTSFMKYNNEVSKNGEWCLTLHVGILDKGIEEVGCLNKGESSVTQRSDRRVHTDSWRNMGMKLEEVFLRSI